MKEYNYIKKWIVTLLLLVSLTILSFSIYYFIKKNYPFLETITTMITGALLPYFIKSIINLTDNNNWKTSQSKLKKAGIINNNTLIRISFAYLFRIQVDGKYFLVKNNRTKKFQPVGGAYKFKQEESNYLSRHIPAENDDRIPVDKVTKRDYRLLIKSKNLRKFVKRFNKTQFRENNNNLSREFKEELIQTSILNKDVFEILTYKFSGRHMTNIKYSLAFNHYELLLADIIEVQLTIKQEDFFKKLMKIKSDKYMFATANEINSLGVKYGTQELEDKIANHTPKILSQNIDELSMRNKNQKFISVKI